MQVWQMAAAEQLTIRQFLNKAWTKVYGKPCRSNMVEMDARTCENNSSVIPCYAASYWRITKNPANTPNDPPTITMTKDLDGVFRQKGYTHEDSG